MTDVSYIVKANGVEVQHDQPINIKAIDCASRFENAGDAAKGTAAAVAAYAIWHGTAEVPFLNDLAGKLMEWNPLTTKGVEVKKNMEKAEEAVASVFLNMPSFYGMADSASAFIGCNLRPLFATVALAGSLALAAYAAHQGYKALYTLINPRITTITLESLPGAQSRPFPNHERGRPNHNKRASLG